MNKKAFKKDIKEIIKTMNYVEALEHGLIDYDNILDYIDAWHESDSELEIDDELVDYLKKYIYTHNNIYFIPRDKDELISRLVDQYGG